MYETTTEASFSAAHYLLNYDGPCENIHGHNWLVKATIRAEKLDTIGLSLDFKILKRELKAVLDEFDHTEINRILKPLNLNPSAENIAHYIYNVLSKRINDDRVKVYKVEVFETPGNSSAYFE